MRRIDLYDFKCLSLTNLDYRLRVSNPTHYLTCETVLPMRFLCSLFEHFPLSKNVIHIVTIYRLHFESTINLPFRIFKHVLSHRLYLVLQWSKTLAAFAGISIWSCSSFPIRIFAAFGGMGLSVGLLHPLLFRLQHEVMFVFLDEAVLPASGLVPVPALNSL